jgi:hypothetical protein
MEPYQILAIGVSRPDRLGVFFDAFDAAWAELAPQISADPLTVADSQEKLARAILTFNQYSMVDPEWIKDAALAIMRKKP